MYLVKFTKQAQKDKKYIKSAGLEQKTKGILNMLTLDPFQNPPPYESLVGNLEGFYSRRINIKHRIVYTVYAEPLESEVKRYEGIVIVARMWTHYEKL